MNKPSAGITLVEILVSLAIFIILATITTVSLSGYRSSKLVETTANEIAFKLEEAKTNALAGKAGSSYGLHFASTSYTYFKGSSYNSSDVSNISPTFPSELQITTSLTGSAVNIIFSRLTGTPNVTGTITVRKTSDTSKTKTITIGTLGDISVVQ